MSGLDDLVVSLTKNGYFKVAEVIIRHPRHEILDKINGVYDGINLNRAQISKMLSADPNTEELPDVWDEVNKEESASVYALTFISILFSHKKLITAFSNANTSEMRGIIRRSILGDKAYTNLAYSMQSAGLCTVIAGRDETRFNLAPLFKDLSIGPLAKKIIKLKLIQTGWVEPLVSDHFKRTYYEQCYYYGFHKALGLSKKQFEQWLEGRDVDIEEPLILEQSTTIIEVSATLVSALASKPFTILCGTAGTGKTRTIKHLVHELCLNDAEKSFNHVFLPVEAGWTDARHLIGYKNPFGKDGEYYSTTPLIQLLLKANYEKYLEIPFFIILDEMNLSYVEKYFSKFLSLMETSYENIQEPILCVDDLKLLLKSEIANPVEIYLIEAAIENKGLFLTKNVFIVGTVNIDETTHMFSPKVLDRSFVVEFITTKPSLTKSKFSISEDDKVKGTIEAISQCLIKEKSTICDDINPFLDEVFGFLGKYGFGHRVTNEIRKYFNTIQYIKEQEDFELSENFSTIESIKDQILMQKLLPKLHGNKGQLYSVIENLLVYADQNNFIRTKSKLEAMTKDLRFPGFTNFFS